MAKLKSLNFLLLTLVLGISANYRSRKYRPYQWKEEYVEDVFRWPINDYFSSFSSSSSSSSESHEHYYYTTKRPIRACKTKCSVKDISITAGLFPDVTAKVSRPYIGKSGCIQITITCSFKAGTFGFMTFNNGAIIVDTGSVATSSHKLICQNDGSFSFTQNGATTVITEVACVADDVPAACKTECSIDDLTLTAGTSPDATATASTPAIGASECLETTLTCSFAAGTTGVMTFNNGALTADTTGAATSTHNLVCNNDGSFSFTQNGATTVITEVACVADDVPAESPCKTECSVADLTLTAGTNPDVTASASTPAIGASECLETTLTCSFTAGTTGVMTFNTGAVTADTAAAATSTHTLVCNDDGNFEFSQNGVNTVITEVACEGEQPTACQTACGSPTFTLTPKVTFTPTTSTPTVGNSGCLETTVTCPFTADTNGLMTFNNDAIYADKPFVDMSSHTLVCQADGSYSFTDAEGTATVINEAACLSTPCNVDSLNIVRFFDEPEYINIQPNGMLTASCSDPENTYAVFQSNVATVIEEDPTTLTYDLTCDAATGMYTSDGLSVTEIGCCTYKCPIPTITPRGMTDQVSSDATIFIHSHYTYCHSGRIECVATRNPFKTATIYINGQPIIQSGDSTLLDIFCDNESKNYMFNGSPVTSIECDVSPQITAPGMGCDSSTLTLTANPGVGPTPEIIIDQDGLVQVNCLFSYTQPEQPTGLLQFNNGALIPSNEVGSDLRYNLYCQADGTTWGFLGVDGTVTPVTEISCLNQLPSV